MNGRALRAGRQPEELARELGVSGQTLRNWLKQADLDEGIRKDGSPARNAVS